MAQEEYAPTDTAKAVHAAFFVFLAALSGALIFLPPSGLRQRWRQAAIMFIAAFLASIPGFSGFVTSFGPRDHFYEVFLKLEASGWIGAVSVLSAAMATALCAVFGKRAVRDSREGFNKTDWDGYCAAALKAIRQGIGGEPDKAQLLEKIGPGMTAAQIKAALAA